MGHVTDHYQTTNVFVWLGFANKDQEGCCRRRLHRPVRGWGGLCETSRSRAVSTHLGQVWLFGGGSRLSFSALSFVFEGVSPVLFKLWSSLVDCVAPGFSVSGNVRPLQAVYVTHIERLLDAVFVAFLRCPSVTMASGEFDIQDHLRQAVVLHSGYVTSPSELVRQ